MKGAKKNALRKRSGRGLMSMTVNGIQTIGCAKIRPVSRVQKGMRATALAGLLSLGATCLSGCEFVYLPECDTECTAGGGDDSYGKAN